MKIDINKRIREIEYNKNLEVVEIRLTDGSTIKFYHDQDCCESVGLEDSDMELALLTGATLISIEESTKEDPQCSDEEGRWTFYRCVTSVGVWTMRWYGSHNGYYSITVDVVEIGPDGKKGRLLFG